MVLLYSALSILAKGSSIKKNITKLINKHNNKISMSSTSFTNHDIRVVLWNDLCNVIQGYILHFKIVKKIQIVLILSTQLETLIFGFYRKIIMLES